MMRSIAAARRASRALGPDVDVNARDVERLGEVLATRADPSLEGAADAAWRRT